MKEKPFECKFCGASFVQETRYLKHKCEKMKRHEEVKTPIGQAAYLLYQNWFKLKKKTPPEIESFINSKHYKSFIKFANFIKRLKISEPNIFMKMMIEKGILPAHWTLDEMYVYYLEYLEKRISLKKQVAITIKTMVKLAEAADVDVSEIFDILNCSDIFQLIRERKFSPWILLRSRKFMAKIELMNEDEKKILENLIRVNYWKQKFESRNQDKQYVDMIVKQLNI